MGKRYSEFQTTENRASRRMKPFGCDPVSFRLCRHTNMFAKQFLETKPWEARSRRHQNSSVVFHWATATSYLLTPLARINRGENPAQFFLTGVLCFWQVSQVMLDHLKWRYTGHWSIPSSWQWGGREEACMGWGAWAALGDQLSVSRGKAVGFGSLSGAAGEALKCGKVVTWWLISPIVWHSSGRVSLLPGSLVVKPSSLLGTRIRPGPVEPWGFNLDLPSLERGTSQPEGSMFELCSPSQSTEEPDRTLLSKLSFLFKQKTTKRACPGSDQRYNTNQDQSKVSKEQKCPLSRQLIL